MIFDAVLYSLLRKYIANTLKGAGALKGASCQIQSIARNLSDDATIITFKWENNAGEITISTAVIPDGKSGSGGACNIFHRTEEEWNALTEEEKNQYDYLFTTDDEETFCISIPEGGTAGQVLVKKSGEDYDAEWGDNEELSDVSACFEPAPVQIIHLFENDERTRGGITYSIQDDVCSFSGTATGSFLLWTKQFKAGTYTMSVDQLTGTGIFTVGKAAEPAGSAQAMFQFPGKSASVTFTLDADYYLRFALYKDNVIDRTFRIWANEGSVALPYSNVTLALTDQALPESVKALIENQPVFLSVQDFNTKPEDMMNNNELNILY